MVTPIYIIENLIDGLVLGGIYALTALGLSLIYRVVGVVNLAHGDFLMLGGLIGYYVILLSGGVSQSLTPLLAAFPIIFLLFMVFGSAFNIGLIRPMVKRKPSDFLIGCVLVTIGASFLIEDITANLAGTLPRGIYLGLGPLVIGEVSIPQFRLISLGIVCILTLLFHLFLKRSFVGVAMRAITQDREGAMMMGVNVNLVSTVVFGVGAFFAAVAGLVYLANGFPIQPYMGVPLTVKALTVMILGGAGSILGPLVGGVIIGVAETLTGSFIDFYWSPAIAIIILIVILLVKPTGLIAE
ncbi:MAG: branched-chain amino acid ABC transporter permease [Nitrososphaerales archaeon]